MSPDVVRVLLVEDNDDHAVLIESAFVEHSSAWQLTHAKTLLEARRFLVTSPTDLVIVDLFCLMDVALSCYLTIENR